MPGHRQKPRGGADHRWNRTRRSPRRARGSWSAGKTA